MTLAYTPSKEDLELMTLRKWKEPKFPFVAFRAKFVEILDANKPGHEPRETDYEGLRMFEDICVVRVDGCHKQPDKLENRFIKLKGMKLCTWGNFPGENTPEVKLVSERSSDGSVKSPWVVLENWCQSQVSEQGRVDAQVNALQNKLKEAEARLSQRAK